MSDYAVVCRLLERAGFAASDDEISHLVEGYPIFAGAVAMLYGVAEARHEVPALRFEVDPHFTEWGTEDHAAR